MLATCLQQLFPEPIISAPSGTLNKFISEIYQLYKYYIDVQLFRRITWYVLCHCVVLKSGCQVIVLNLSN